MTETIITKIARNCALQVGSLGLKGKARDNATVAFWAGAHAALLSVEHEDAGWVWNVTSFLICTRGWAEVENLIAKADAAAKEGTA